MMTYRLMTWMGISTEMKHEESSPLAAACIKGVCPFSPFRFTSAPSNATNFKIIRTYGLLATS